MGDAKLFALKDSKTNQWHFLNQYLAYVFEKQEVDQREWVRIPVKRIVGMIYALLYLCGKGRWGASRECLPGVQNNILIPEQLLLSCKTA